MCRVMGVLLSYVAGKNLHISFCISMLPLFVKKVVRRRHSSHFGLLVSRAQNSDEKIAKYTVVDDVSVPLIRQNNVVYTKDS